MSKKILLFLSLIFLICISSYRDSLAEQYIVSLPELPTEPSGFEYYYIKKISDNEYNLYWINTTGVSIQNNNYYFNGKWWGWSYRVTEDINNHVWANRWGWYNGASDNTLIMPVNGTLDDCNIVYSNFDIKYNDKLLRNKLELNTEPIEPSDEVTLSGISGFFNNLLENLKQFFNNLGNKIIDLGITINNLVTNIINTILDIPNQIITGLQTILEFLFVPDTSLFNGLEEKYSQKFGAFFQIRELLEEICDINLYNGTPHFEITYKGKKYEIIDFTIFNDYRSYICAISSFLMIYDTLMWLLRNAPNVIANGSTDNGTILTNHSNNNNRISLDI